MNALALVLIPTVATLLLALPFVRARATSLLVIVTAIVSAFAIGQSISPDTASELGNFVRIDPTAQLFLGVVNPIFLGVTIYIWARVSNTPSLAVGMAKFTFFSLFFLAAANATLIANQFYAQWIALEATTLCAAPLIIRANRPSSQFASWRYLLFSSVGLGLVLLGLHCMARAMPTGDSGGTFFFDALQLLDNAASGPWSSLGLALILLGIGTKLGLAPMYTWLPEAYDEAPPAVTALLSTVQFNCALAFLFRVVQAFRPSHTELVMNTLVAMGILSMVVSTLSIIATRDMKRLIAYASINHAGVIAIGLGVGKAASYGLLLYVVSNAFIKAILFLTVGKITAHYATKDTRLISGLIKDLPYSGVFLMIGTFALLGFPPFGSFFGELLILSALVSSQQMLVFATFCLLITMTFVAMGRTIFPMIWGTPQTPYHGARQTFLSASPKIGFLIALVVLGIYIPPVVNTLIEEVASTLEGY